MERNTLFIISSAIYITEKPLSYTPTRTVFSAEERGRQTLDTILSIRKALPNSKIMLIEMGLEKALPCHVEYIVDKYLYLGNKKIIRDAVDGPYKGYGEALGLYLANPWILRFNADYYFKISGRYYLNNEFTLSDWQNDGYSAKGGNGVFYTAFYGFPHRIYADWRQALKKSTPGLLRGEAIENALPRYLTEPVFYKRKIGLSGNISHSGELVAL